MSSAVNGNPQEFSGLQPGLYEIYSYGPDGKADGEPKQIRIVPGSGTLVDPNTAVRLTRVEITFEGGDPDQTPQITFTDPVSGRVIVEAAATLAAEMVSSVEPRRVAPGTSLCRRAPGMFALRQVSRTT